MNKLKISTLPCETWKSYFVKIPIVKNHKVNTLYLFTQMSTQMSIAKWCSYNKCSLYSRWCSL